MLKKMLTTTMAATVLLGSVAAASAQYFPPPPPPYGDPYARPYGERPPRYDDRRRYGDDDDDYRPRRRYDDRGPRARANIPNGYGQVCVTSRGNCPAYGPMNTGCVCDIPGFGEKRGGIH